MSIFSSQATAAALSFFKNEKFCYTEDDFQPLHYNLVMIVELLFRSLALRERLTAE